MLSFIKYIIVLSIFLNTGNTSSISKFEKDYKFEIKNAEYHYKKIKPELTKQSKKYKTDSNIISAIIFPELIRYSMFRDFFETTVLEFFYVEQGSKAANFSIGIFQIKPSFVEQLEAEIKKYSELNKYRFITKFTSVEPSQIRKERLNRLKSTKWQLIYLNCFYSLMETKYPTSYFANKANKVKFYATVYNHGFNCSKTEIKKWTKIKTFPHGLNSNKQNYSYAGISLYYYNKLKH